MSECTSRLEEDHNKVFGASTRRAERTIDEAEREAIVEVNPPQRAGRPHLGSQCYSQHTVRLYYSDFLLEACYCVRALVLPLQCPTALR